MARRVNALAAMSGFAALSFAFPPLLVMSFATLGLVTMRKGGREGVLLLLGCITLFAVMSFLLTQVIRADLMILATLWLMVWCGALVYRFMSTPAWMINAVGVIGLCSVAGFYLVVSDPAAFWLVILEQHLKPIFVEQQMLSSDAELDQLLKLLAGVLTGGFAALICVLLIVSLLLARWWQAMLYNPGGFRQEFYQLRLGHITATVLIVLLIVSMVGRYAIFSDMATVLWLLFFFQGLAVVHGLIGMTGLGIGWLVTLYMLLAIVPNYASPVVSGLGLVDTWFNFRRRVPKKNKPDITE